MQGSWRAALLLVLLAFASGLTGTAASESDWLQLAHDAARNAHAPRGVPPPYRAR